MLLLLPKAPNGEEAFDPPNILVELVLLPKVLFGENENAFLVELPARAAKPLLAAVLLPVPLVFPKVKPVVAPDPKTGALFSLAVNEDFSVGIEEEAREKAPGLEFDNPNEGVVVNEEDAIVAFERLEASPPPNGVGAFDEIGG